MNTEQQETTPGVDFPPEIPVYVTEQLAAEGIQIDDIRIGVKSDLDPDGRFGEQWLIVTARDVFVLHHNQDDPAIRHHIPICDIRSAKVERCVGNGLLQVTVGFQPVVLLHYSNKLTDRFGRVARYLERRVECNDPSIPPPASSEGHCLVCGHQLADASAKVCPSCVQRGHIARRLAGLARPYWKHIGLILVLLLCGVALDLMPPYLIRILIDDVLKAGDRQDLLLQLVGALLGIQLVRVVITISTNWLTINVSTRFTASIREQLFVHLNRLPIDYFDKNQTGRLMTRINQDTDELQGLISQATTFALNIMLVIGIGAVLFSMSPSLGLYVLIPTPFVIAGAVLYYRRMRPHFSRVWVARWRLNAMLNTFLSGVRVVKAFAQESREEARYRDRNRTLLTSHLQVDLAWSKFYPIISFAFAAGGLIIWYAGGRAVLSQVITVGTLMAFLSYLGMFYGPLSSLTQVSQTMNRFLTISQRVFEMLDEQPQPQMEEPRHSGQLSGHIEFDHVMFGYDPYYPVVRDLSFSIEPGEMVGVVGHSGAGKSTLINLLSRFYDVTSGAIRIDGVDIRELSTDDIRRQIGIVLQTPFLFRGTLADNIAYGRPEASRDEIIQAAVAANAHDFVTMLPEGYDTIVGEGGTGLSGGEMQRISIARAILHNPRILILDEATSSLDTATERQIQSALDTLIKGRTTIAIAHRLSTLANADRILVLNHGRLEEQGPPAALLSNRGAFYKLVQMQTQFGQLEHASGF